MPQSLIRLPETAWIIIGLGCVNIENHEVKSTDGLIGNIVRIALDSDSQGDTLREFEKHGVSYEAAIECCVTELEHDTSKLSDLIFYNYLWNNVGGLDKRDDYRRKSDVYSASVSGRKMAEQLVEEIRNCNDWGELYDQVNLSMEFHKDIKKKIEKEMTV